MRLQQSRQQTDQKGFALLTVLMIVALVAMVASQLVYEQHANIKRSSYMMHQAQSFSIVWGIETWVNKGLTLDRKNNKNDHLEELWAKPLGPIPYEGGMISGQLFDLQSRLNVNNVLEKDQVQRKIWQAILKRYADRHELPPEFVDLVTDWVDEDNEILPFGAESDQYLLLNPAYSAANQPMVMLSEIKLLQGLGALKRVQWLQMEQDLAALPEVVKLNINTATKDVLMSLTEWMTEEIANSWQDERADKPAETPDEFRAFLVTETGFTAAEVLTDLPNWLIGTKSDYFLFNAEVNFGDSNETISAIFSRKTNKDVKLVQRWLSVTETLQ